MATFVQMCPHLSRKRVPPLERKGARVRPLVGSLDLWVMGQTAGCRRLFRFLPEPSDRLPHHSDPHLVVSVDGNTEGSSGVFLLDNPPARLGRGSGQELRIIAPRLRIVLRHGEIQVGLGRDVSGAALRSALDVAWPLSLSPFGYYRLHCGAVRDPDGSGWLLVGDSGRGKSTSTMALATSGWRYAADDAAYIVQKDGNIVAHGWQVPVNLTAASAASLGISIPGDFAGAKCAPNLPEHIASRRVSELSVNRLLFPEFGARSSLEPLSAADALVRLVRASPWLFCQAELAVPYLACLRAAAMLPAARLILGPELLQAPQRLAELLSNSERTIA